MNELSIDTFGEIMDKFIKDNHIQLLIDIPEGTNEAEVADNTPLGPVMQFYILLAAIKPVATSMFTRLQIDEAGKRQLLDALFVLLRKEILEDARMVPGGGGDD